MPVRWLKDHPAFQREQERWEKLRAEGMHLWQENIPRGEQELLNHLHQLRSLDSEAVYMEVGGATVVYYGSPRSPKDDYLCARLVLVDGKMKRIDRLNFRPQVREGVVSITIPEHRVRAMKGMVSKITALIAEDSPEEVKHDLEGAHALLRAAVSTQEEFIERVAA